MRLTTSPRRRLFLSPGETVPVVCSCGALYFPQFLSVASRCPLCERENAHLQMEIEVVLKTIPTPYSSGV